MIGNSTRVPPTPLIPMHAEKSHLLNWMEGKWSRYGRSSPAAPLAERSPGSRACIFLVVPANRSDHSRLQVSGYAQSGRRDNSSATADNYPRNDGDFQVGRSKTRGTKPTAMFHSEAVLHNLLPLGG